MEDLYVGRDYKEREKDLIQSYKDQGYTLLNVYHNNVKRMKRNPFTIQSQTIDSNEESDDSYYSSYQESSSDEDFI